jgi:hypothetical protein
MCGWVRRETGRRYTEAAPGAKPRNAPLTLKEKVLRALGPGLITGAPACERLPVGAHKKALAVVLLTLVNRPTIISLI